MTRALRIIDTGLRPPRWNVAMTAALAELHARAAIADTVRVHRYLPSVLVGRNEDIDSAADVTYCRSAGIDIARRVTGGGAVFMSAATLAWDVVLGVGAFGSLEVISRRVGEGVAAGLSRLGVAARYRAPNEIEIGGRKVSGSAGYARGRSAILQGTILVADDVEVMAASLRLPLAALRQKMVCLADVCGQVPSSSMITACLVHGLTSALELEPTPTTVSSVELACTEALLNAEIGSDAFVRGATKESAA